MTKEDSSVRETLPEDQAKFIASEQKASLISRATELCISSTPERQDYCSTSTDLSKPLIERKKQLPHAEGFPNLSLPPPIEAESIGSFSTLKHPTELGEITDAVKAHLLQLHPKAAFLPEYSLASAGRHIRGSGSCTLRRY